MGRFWVGSWFRAWCLVTVLIVVGCKTSDECKSGELRCLETMVQRCHGGRWKDDLDCTLVGAQCEMRSPEDVACVAYDLWTDPPSTDTTSGTASDSGSPTDDIQESDSTRGSDTTMDAGDDTETGTGASTDTDSEAQHPDTDSEAQHPDTDSEVRHPDTESETETERDSESGSDLDKGSDWDSEVDTANVGCTGVDEKIATQSVNILILLDRSKSMSVFELDGTSFEKIVDTALAGIVTNTENKHINFGLAVFPSVNCVREGASDASQLCYAPENVTVPIGNDIGDNIASHLLATDTCGGTPLAATLKWAKDYLESRLPAVLLRNPTYILLITDGAPNCASDLDTEVCVNSSAQTEVRFSEQCLDDIASIRAASALFEGSQGNGFTAIAADTQESFILSVPTYIVGIGGELDSWTAVMEDIANAGGGRTGGDGNSSHYFHANSDDAIGAALKKVVADTHSCTFPIDWQEVNVSAVQKRCDLVKLVSKSTDDARPLTELTYSPDCEDPTGWRYKGVSGDGRDLPLDSCLVVELCEDACDALKSGLWTEIDFRFGC